MKSPLKAKPLRNPGQSLEDDIVDVLLNEVFAYYFFAAVLTIVAGLEWWRWYANTPPTPVVASVTAVTAISVAVWRIRRARGKVKNLALGRDGERAVGQYLDALRASGARVFHDVPGRGFNLDHVIVHASGVYVVETKTWSKPDRGEAKILFTGESVLRFGQEPDRNPITQVRAGRQWLKELLEESTGRKPAVRAVVVFPGWFVEPTAESKNSDVWALNPKALPSFISHSAESMPPEDVKLFAFHLGRYVRSEAAAQGQTRR